MGKVFLVMSGKGGVGKTTVCANLAAALAERYRVLVVDADLEMANLDLVFGCRSEHVYDLQDVYLGRCAPEDALFPIPSHPRLTALFAPLRKDTSYGALLRYLRGYVSDRRRLYDFILVDCPSGLGETAQILCDPRFEALVVATPDRTSMSDGERTAEFLYRHSVGKARLIVNRVRPALIRKGSAPDIDTVMDTTSLPLLGLIPEDVSVIRGENAGTLPFDLPKAPCRKAFRNIALRLCGESVDLSF